MTMINREIKSDSPSTTQTGGNFSSGDNTGSKNAILSSYKPPHHGIHVHHVLLCNLFVQSVYNHDSQQYACPFGQRARHISNSSQNPYSKSSHHCQGPDVPIKQSLQYTFVSSEAWNLKARCHHLFCL